MLKGSLTLLSVLASSFEGFTLWHLCLHLPLMHEYYPHASTRWLSFTHYTGVRLTYKGGTQIGNPGSFSTPGGTLMAAVHGLDLSKGQIGRRHTRLPHAAVRAFAKTCSHVGSRLIVIGERAGRSACAGRPRSHLSAGPSDRMEDSP